VEALIAEDTAESSISVTSTVGVEGARRLVRSFCLEAGMSRLRAEELVLAASELATNLVRHSQGGGTITCALGRANTHRAVEVIARDNGPGIADTELALTDGYTTRSGLGGGLSSARELVDEFEIESEPGDTRIRMRKWLD
jgi:serine/threonine-protein kinase RsbT